MVRPRPLLRSHSRALLRSAEPTVATGLRCALCADSAASQPRSKLGGLAAHELSRPGVIALQRQPDFDLSVRILVFDEQRRFAENLAADLDLRAGRLAVNAQDRRRAGRLPGQAKPLGEERIYCRRLPQSGSDERTDR